MSGNKTSFSSRLCALKHTIFGSFCRAGAQAQSCTYNWNLFSSVFYLFPIYANLCRKTKLTEVLKSFLVNSFLEKNTQCKLACRFHGHFILCMTSFPFKNDSSSTKCLSACSLPTKTFLQVLTIALPTFFFYGLFCFWSNYCPYSLLHSIAFSPGCGECCTEPPPGCIFNQYNHLNCSCRMKELCAIQHTF